MPGISKTVAAENPATLPLVGNELVRIVQSGASVRTTTQDIANLRQFPLTSKGQLLVYGTTGVEPFNPGTDGYTLSSDSTQESGLRWVTPGVSYAQLATASGAGYVGVQQVGSGAILRTLNGINLDKPLDARDYGAACDGATDDTAAITKLFTAGIAQGRAVTWTGTCLSGIQNITGNLVILGRGRWGTTVFKSKAGTNNHGLYVIGDYRLIIRDVELDGNRANNPTLSPNFPVGVLVPVGSLDIQDCNVHDWRCHCIHTGNTDWQFNASLYAHDCIIAHNFVSNGTSSDANQDCIRVHRTQKCVVHHNETNGGLSSIRSNYYCDSLDISHNLCHDNYGDVGVTFALSTNIIGIGNRCWTNGQHGMEIDGCKWGLISDNVSYHNVVDGYRITEYGPPTGTSYQGQYIDGTSITYPNVYSNVDVTFSENGAFFNGQFGMRLTGQAGIVVRGGIIEGNNTSASGNPYGMYIEGGTLNQDNFLVDRVEFRNTNNQTGSIGRANVQFQTRTGGNFHTPGTQQWSHPPRGRMAAMYDDPFLRSTTNLSVTVGALVEDTTSAHHFARQIVDSTTSGNVTITLTMGNLPSAGYKLFVARIRTPDTMTACTINVNLFQGVTFKNTVASIGATGLSSAWRDFVVAIPDSLKSFAYDNIQASIVTDNTLTGSINIEEMQLYGVYEWS